MRPDDPILTPKERVALGALLFFIVFSAFGIVFVWNSFAERKRARRPPVAEQAVPDVHAALDRALSDISNVVNAAGSGR